ncbi:MAG: hypothetical protein QM820_57825 [Minicystis sp.]
MRADTISGADLRGAVISAIFGSALALAGCSGSVETMPGMGGSGGTGGTPACTASCEATIEGWSTASTLLTARRDHATFIVDTPAGAFLYVAGGASTTAWTSGVADVERAEIHADGSVGPFSVVATLPGLSTQAGAVQAGRTVLLIGGRDSISLPDVYVGTVADDGSIGFTMGPPLGVARQELAAVAHGGFVYAIGGIHVDYDPETQVTVWTYEDVIERAPFDGTTLGPFEMAAPLAQPLASHAAAVANDSLYVLGGQTSGSTDPTPDVQRAPLGQDGTVGVFGWAGAFVNGRTKTAAFALSGSMFAIGGAGQAGGDRVLRAPLHEDGTMGAFAEMTPLPGQREVRQAPVHGNFVYVAGGALDQDGDPAPQPEVFVGKIVVQAP